MLKGSERTKGDLIRPAIGNPGADTFQAIGAGVGVRDITLENPEDLREATRGADLRIVQLASGAFEGRLTHAEIGKLFLSAGDFGPDIRARGVMNPGLVTIGTMLESSGEVSQWDYDVLPGDIVLFPKSVEQEGRFTGRCRYITITLGEEELAAHAKNEGRLQDPEFWTRICRFRLSEAQRVSIRRKLAQKVTQLRRNELPLSASGIDFFRRSIIEAFLSGIVHQTSEACDGRNGRGARLVREVEDYVDAFGTDRPVHVSELCATLAVSRRALHRAFQDVLGVGPAAYLRLRRLAAIHGALKAGKLPRGSVTQIALEYGFGDLGRFAGYYRRIFNETPSQTVSVASLQNRR